MAPQHDIIYGTSHDILIVGAGTAGMVCAICAAEHGARNILVVEKSERVGGTLHLSSAHLSAAGTQRQKQCGIEDSPEAHYADIMRITHNTADPVLTSLAVHEAAQTLEWLESLGFPLEESTPKLVYGHVPYSTPRTVFAPVAEGGRLLLSVLEPLWDKHVRSGAIMLRLGHRLRKIVYDQHTQTIHGIVCENTDGEQVELRSRNVVIACGGYSKNSTLFRDLMPPNTPRLRSAGAETSLGEGMEAAMRIGAQFRNAEHHVISIGGIEFEPNSGTVDYWKAWAGVFSSLHRTVREIYVNAEGKRFLNEDEPNADTRERAVMAQPGWQFWVLFDDAALEASYQEGTPLVRQWESAEVVRTLAEGGKFLWKADSWAALATKVGFSAEHITETITAFQMAAAARRPDEMGRSMFSTALSGVLSGALNAPPYYALLVHGCSLISFGGLAANADLQVLDTANTPITGLYAIGEVLGAGATSGNAFCSGMLITPAISFGRILGRRLATMTV